MCVLNNSISKIMSQKIKGEIEKIVGHFNTLLSVVNWTNR